MAGQGDDERDDSRSIADNGTQENAQAPVGGDGGRSSYGPPLSVGGKQEPGGLVPPYDGRKESAEPDQEGGTRRGGVRVGGATGPVDDAEMKAPSPSDTPGGRTASPGGEPPKTEDDADYPGDPGVGPAHVTGAPKAEGSGG